MNRADRRGYLRCRDRVASMEVSDQPCPHCYADLLLGEPVDVLPYVEPGVPAELLAQALGGWRCPACGEAGLILPVL